MTTQVKDFVSHFTVPCSLVRDGPDSAPRTAQKLAHLNHDASHQIIPIVVLNDDPRPVAFSSYGDLSNVSNTSNMAIRSMSSSSEDCNAHDLTSLDGGRSNGPTSFRVIIVGGGPTGLATAHALNLAGIDWIILEQRPEITTAVGAAIILWPHTLRILDQLGLLDEARNASFPMRTKTILRSDGRERNTTEVSELLIKNHGRPWVPMSRARLIEMLYENLEGKDQRVFTKKSVTDIESHDTGVRVTCGDGSVVDGSIVIGSDGAHSVVRETMNKLSAEKEPRRRRRLPLSRCLSLGRSTLSPPTASQQKQLMKANFHGLIGWVPLLDGLEPHAVCETRVRNGVGIAVHSGGDVAYFAVYVKPKKKKDRQQPVYTAEDADALAADLAEHPVTASVRFGEVWEARHWGAMVDYEEGVADMWHHERVVLLGDSAHTFTPSAGLALNTAWQDMVDLVNRLRATIVEQQQPGTEKVKSVFEAYQRSRQGPAKAAMRFSAGVTRTVTHEGPVYRFIDWMMPVLGGDVMALTRMFEWIVKKGVVFDFVPERGFKEGRVRWVHGRAVGDRGGKGEEESLQEELRALYREDVEWQKRRSLVWP